MFVGGRFVEVGTVGRGVKVMVAGPLVGVLDGVNVGNGVSVGPRVLVGGEVGRLPPLIWICPLPVDEPLVPFVPAPGVPQPISNVVPLKSDNCAPKAACKLLDVPSKSM